MAALIPAIGTCVSNMTGGERRLAYRLEQKLEDDWLLWYDVPLGPRNVHPDFVVFNPRRGLLVLEVKDWKLDTIRDIDRQIKLSQAPFSDPDSKFHPTHAPVLESLYGSAKGSFLVGQRIPST